MTKKVLLVKEGSSPRVGETATNLLALGSWEAIEEGLAQVAEEALRFFVARHPAWKAVELAEAFLAGVCWAISETTG